MGRELTYKYASKGVRMVIGSRNLETLQKVNN
jgi:hypothetical protein